MAKMIVIPEKDWKILCEKLRDSVELDSLRRDIGDGVDKASRLHRIFNYHICTFFREVEDA